MKQSYSATIQMHGLYSDVYKSEWFNNLICSELDQEILKERTKLFKRLKPFTNLFEKDWTGTMSTTIGSGYSETLSYGHPTSVSPELSFVMSYGSEAPVLTQMRRYDDMEFIDDVRRYLDATKPLHTEDLHKVYRGVCEDLLDHYGRKCKIGRATDYSSHCFSISPEIRSGNDIFIQAIIVPKYRNSNHNLEAHMRNIYS
jgi:hypothetical protein